MSKKLYAWFVADTCCGEIFTDLFCSFNFDLAVYFLKSNYLNPKYERLVLYRDQFHDWDSDILDENDKKLLCV